MQVREGSDATSQAIAKSVLGTISRTYAERPARGDSVAIPWQAETVGVAITA